LGKLMASVHHNLTLQNLDNFSHNLQNVKGNITGSAAPFIALSLYIMILIIFNIHTIYYKFAKYVRVLYMA